MDKKNIPSIVTGEVIDVAEHANYLELTSRICYYDEPNLNGDMLPYDDTTLTRAETLVNMPVQARYRVNANNEPSLGGHEMVRKRDGSIEFKTQSIGVHTSVEIKKDNVVLNNGEIKELPCLFASYRIWKRYPNYIAAIKRLFDNNMLYGSWEISTYKYVYDNGIRKITDYEFFANTLLGESNPPSYGVNATALSMATLDSDSQLMIAEALSQDLIDNNNDDKEDNLQMANKEKSIVAEEVKKEVVTPANTESNVSEKTSSEVKSETNVEAEKETTSVTDSAQLTDYDLRVKVTKACRDKLDKWCWVSFMFPNEKEVWCEYEGAETELDFVKFTYEVGEDDTITVSDPEYVKLTVSIAEINTKVATLEKDVETVKAELDIKNDAITKASEKIQELNIKISELEPFKEQVEAERQKQIETEIAEEKERLKAKMLKGNLFTEAEITEDNIAKLIEARDESAINSLIADKFVASFDSKDESDESVDTASVDEGSANDIATASLETDEEETDARSFMRTILFN